MTSSSARGYQPGRGTERREEHGRWNTRPVRYLRSVPQAADGQDPAMSTTIILDCDPGIDDALAIAFAAGSPEIELAGITTVAGNVELAKTTANALAVASFVGVGGRAGHRRVRRAAAAPGAARRARARRDRPGRRGAAAARAGGRRRARHRLHHRQPRPPRPGEITLVATGPLTNIGLALRREPRLASWVKDFVIMGGSASRGNVTPAAEFNIWADPEAAAIVFGAGWTSRADDRARRHAAAPGRRPPSRSGCARSARSARGCCCRRSRSTGTRPTPTGEPPVHDVCAIVSIADPSVFELHAGAGAGGDARARSRRA